MTRRALAPLASTLLIACAPAPPREPEPAEPGRMDATPGIVLGGACTTSGPERCFDARADNCNGLIDDGCGLATGYLQFAMAWAEEAADLELEVTDPNGELAEVGRATASGLVKQLQSLKQLQSSKQLPAADECQIESPAQPDSPCSNRPTHIVPAAPNGGRRAGC